MVAEFFKCDHPGRMSGDERRENILRAAVELFSQRGFKGTTTKEIAKAVGVSEAIIFRHFATKDDLYAAILHSNACEGEEQMLPWEGDETIARAIAEKADHEFFYLVALGVINKHHDRVSFLRLLFFSALEEHELAEQFFQDFISRVYEFIGGYIRTRQQDGAFREFDPRIAVRAFMGMLIHHSLNNILWDKNRVILDLSNEEAARHFTQILLGGIRLSATPEK